jgi:UDP-N-acetylmuramate dehydrogenase
LIFAGLNILKNISLQTLNTMGIDVLASNFVEVETVSQLLEALEWSETNKKEIMVLGGGSNVLFTRDFDGLIIQNKIRTVEIIEETKDSVFLHIGAGENWHELVQYTVDQNWYGIENLALIPGSVGAAPIQNIGAYGVELKDVLTKVHAIDLQSKNTRTFSNEECKFAYRDSVFKSVNKGKFTIVGIEIGLSKVRRINIEYGDIRKVLDEMDERDIIAKTIFDAVCKIRKSKLPDPAVLGNTGSFFKNPIVSMDIMENIKSSHPDVPMYPVDENRVKIPAGWLIEKSGWKGKRIGETGNHEKQALVIVNYGKATGIEVLEHANRVIDDIKNKFGIELQAEVNIIR